MREILFRGKTQNGHWVYGSLIHAGTYCCILEREDKVHPMDWPYLDDDLGTFDGAATPVDPDTIGQFTGLIDKTGKKIFEGDIIRFREWRNGDMCWAGRVHYEHQQFVVSGGPNKECNGGFLVQMSRFDPKNIRIIGNIYDNPMMKGEKL